MLLWSSITQEILALIYTPVARSLACENSPASAMPRSIKLHRCSPMNEENENPSGWKTYYWWGAHNQTTLFSYGVRVRLLIVGNSWGAPANQRAHALRIVCRLKTGTHVSFFGPFPSENRSVKDEVMLEVSQPGKRVKLVASRHIDTVCSSHGLVHWRQRRSAVW